MANIRFLFVVMGNRIHRQPKDCPYCGGNETRPLGTKHIFLQLRECSHCGLMFRYPKDDAETIGRFYEERYQEVGIATELPSPEILKELQEGSFKRSERDFTQKIEMIREYYTDGKAIDFGCSWGYGAYQLESHGYKAEGYEIAKTRADFGRKSLGINIYEDIDTLLAEREHQYNFIFCNHVLEHVQGLFQVLQGFNKLLIEEGLLFIFVPDCTGCEDKEIFLRKKSYAFGEKHPIAFSDEFFQKNLPSHGFAIERITHGAETDMLNDSEMAIIARKTAERWG